MNPILQKDMEDIFSRNNSWERLENSTVVLTGAYGMLASYIVYFLTKPCFCKLTDLTNFCLIFFWSWSDHFSLTFSYPSATVNLSTKKDRDYHEI